MATTNIDPALGLMAEFSKGTKGMTRHIAQMRQEAIFSEGVVPARFKTLVAVIWAVSEHCEPCFTFYVHKAAALGVTEMELGEVLAVASAMGGCVGEMWALKAYKAYKDFSQRHSTLETDPSCCISQ